MLALVKSILLFQLVGLGTASPPNSDEAAPPTATVDAGVLVGTTTAVPDAPVLVNQFLGVPFAAPPVRFQPPRDVDKWTGELAADTRSATCIQQFPVPESLLELSQKLLNTPPSRESEDCLYLNVFAPSTPTPAQGRPVLFWIYGGGLWLGDAARPAYDGSVLAANQDVVVVAANYRTNVFGFPWSPDIPLTERNLGFLDQRAALAWVNRNIHAFGGDAAKVTIFGESAGAFSVDALLTSTNSHADAEPPLFRAAIMESGQLSYRGTPNAGKPLAPGGAAWDALAAALNCSTRETQQSTLDCVAAAPADTIRTILDREKFLFNPVTDNRTLYADIAGRRRRGEIARIPLLSGTNADEGRFSVYGQSNLTAYLQQLLGGDVSDAVVAAVQQVYPVGNETGMYASAFDALAALETDVSFQCNAALVANDTAAMGAGSWRYYYNASFPNTEVFPDSRVYHTSEIGMVFGTYPSAGSTPAQRELSRTMQKAWADFARDPDVGPGWDAIDVEKKDKKDVAVFTKEKPGGVKMVLQSEIDARCAFWSDVLAGRY